MDSMYDILLGLPLFKGVSHNKISEIVGSTKFHFLKFAPGEQIVKAGDACSHIKFIISGKTSMEIVSDDQRFRIKQTLSAPEVLAPDFLFGRTTTYPGTVTALETTGIMQIAKSDYVDILHTDRVFLFNFLNLLSRNAQKSVDGILAVTTGSLEQRIAFWIIALTQPNASDITLSCRHRDLYTMFGVQRNVFYTTLDRMKQEGLIDYAQNEIRIISREKLKDKLLN